MFEQIEEPEKKDIDCLFEGEGFEDEVFNIDDIKKKSGCKQLELFYHKTNLIKEKEQQKIDYPSF